VAMLAHAVLLHALPLHAWRASVCVCGLNDYVRGIILINL
jgi:hypothetical protein